MGSQRQSYIGKKHVNELRGLYIKYVISSQRAPTAAESVNGPVTGMTGPVEVNQLLSFAIPELAQNHHEQSKTW